jgi:hypothetical protein
VTITADIGTARDRLYRIFYGSPRRPIRPSKTTCASRKSGSATATRPSASSSATTPPRPSARGPSTDTIRRLEAELDRIDTQRSKAKNAKAQDAHTKAECALRDDPALGRYLRQTPSGRLRIDRAKIAAEAKLDGKFLLSTSDPDLSAEDVALGYKNLLEAERGFRDLKTTLETFCPSSPIRRLTRPTGFEPVTFGSVDRRCSIGGGYRFRLRLSRKSGCCPVGLRPFGDGTEFRRV